MQTLTKIGINEDGELYMVFDNSNFVSTTISEGDTSDDVMSALEDIAAQVQNVDD
ncbi:hypothetical protein [Neptuniibacter pectenicola]|uniref:hypothetical protein n=1 Tax=Neptuniibacter pectenicola TaxID=1806669 RepID=UPI000AB63A10|nr:hypothetical protein [Neptuniibacter pectenicola]